MMGAIRPSHRSNERQSRWYSDKFGKEIRLLKSWLGNRFQVRFEPRLVVMSVTPTRIRHLPARGG